MRSRLWNFWRNTTSSFWFLPSIAVMLALILASVLVEVDADLIQSDHLSLPWLFGGTADAAHSVLSTIAGSLITVISIAFSLTVVALQQASSQFSPRVLRRFTADRGNQVVLGAYIGTFVYALMVLRQVRSADEGAAAFVPALSISVAIGLAIVCVGLLIYFIHHISQALQVDLVQRQIHAELLKRLDQLYPSMIGEGTDDDRPAEEVVAQYPGEGRWLIRSTDAGFLRSVDEQRLLDAPYEGIRWIWFRPRIGQFVIYNDVLAEVGGNEANRKQVTEAVRGAIAIDATRTTDQDLLFDVRQLVDIALRALSPSINDPTTAEHALYYLGDALARLGQRVLPSTVRTAHQGSTRVILSRPSWDDFVAAAFDQIRRASQDDVHVTVVLLHALRDLRQQVSSPKRMLPVQRQIAAIRSAVERQQWSSDDKEAVLRHASGG